MSLITFEVKETSRLDRALRQEGSLSVQVAKGLIKEGKLFVNGHLVKKPAFEVRPGDQIRCEMEPAEKSIPKPPVEKRKLDVLFEDETIICVQKPSGRLSVPASHSQEISVQDLVSRMLSEKDPEARAYAVHRLDRFASGALLFAKSRRDRDAIMAQFKSRTVHKTYYALIRGVVAKDQLRGAIKIPINDDRMQARVLVGEGREAVTEYEVIVQENGFVWVKAFPQTGRRHQVRVHLAQTLGPIVGDQTYGERIEFSVPRLMLHCYEMKLEHPILHQPLQVAAPFTEDFVTIANTLGVSPPRCA